VSFSGRFKEITEIRQEKITKRVHDLGEVIDALGTIGRVHLSQRVSRQCFGVYSDWSVPGASRNTADSHC
jgi:hypothetical protein